NRSYIAASFILGLVRTTRIDGFTDNSFSQEELREIALVLALLNTGRRQPLTEELRESWAEDFGKAWLERTTEGYKLLGGYDCHFGISYVSSDLLPFDVLATIFHEFEHMADDRNTSTKLSLLSVRQRISVSEFMGAWHAAFVQINA